MAMPTVILEVAFTTDPGATPTWTDISDYLREFTIHRGKTGELDRYAAGRATFVLANEDRRFDPMYTSSPYSPNVVPMRKVRLRSTYAAVTYDEFTGYADGWSQTYEHPQEARCTLTATDAFKVLANIELPSSAYATEVRADSPSHWWRLGEPAGSTLALDTIGTSHLSAFGSPTFGAAGLTVRDPDTAVTLPGVATQRFEVETAAGPTGTDWTFEFIMKQAPFTSAGAAASGVIYSSQAYAVLNVGVFAVFVMASDSGVSPNKLEVVINDNLGYTGATVADSTPHHVAITRSGATTLVYVDGTLSLTVPAYTAGATTADTVARLFPVLSGSYNALSGTYDEIAIYPTALSAARIAAHSSARAVAWSGETSGARVGRILDAAGWASADRNIDTGVATLQGADLGGNALAALQKVEETEQGRLFVTGDGKVRFIARDKLLQAPYTTSQATFGDSGAELEYEDLTYRYDDSLIFNEAVVSRADGTAQTVKDATSQTRYLRRTRVVDGLLHVSDATSVDLANWIVAHYKDPLLRVTDLTLHPTAGNETTHFPQVLGRELAERVTVRRKPQNLGTVIDQAVAIEGIEHSVSAVDWVTRWNLSPAETETYWILGVAGASELGETSRLAF
jgi:hypothetical protein